MNHIQSAHREWKSNNAASAWQHLNECQERFRGWEYHYLNHLTARNFETFEGHSGTGLGSAVVFSPDGSQIVSASTDEVLKDGVLKRWDAITRELASTVTLKEFDFDGVDSMAFSSDCSHVVAVGFTRDSSQVKVWNTSTGEPTVTINPGFLTNIYAVAFSPDGSRVVAGIMPKPGERRLALWDSRTGEEMWTTESGIIFAVAFSPDGSRIVSGHMPDGTLTVWDMSTGKAILTLRGHTAGVNAVAFSPDGSKIVSGSNDETLMVWDAGTGKQLLKLNGHNHAVVAAAFSPDGSRIVSGSQDKTLKLWDASTGTEMQTLKGPKDAPFIVNFNPDGSRVVSASGTTFQLWNPSAKPKSLAFYAHVNRGPQCVVFNPEGTRIVTSGQVMVKVWDSTTGGRTLTFGDWKGPRYKSPVALSPDGRLIVAQTKDGRLKLLDAATGEETLTLGQLGRLYLNWGRLKLAEQHFREDLDIARRIGDLRGESQMYNFLGIVALQSEDLESAAAYLDHSMAMAQRGKWTVAEGFARKDRGLCCLAEGQRQPAEVQFQLAEQLFSEVGFAEGIAHVNRGLGVLLRMNAKWLESEQRLRRSLQHFEQAGELTEIVLTRLEMSRTLRESSAPLPLVRDSFLDALRYAERSRRPHLVQEVERELEVIAPEAARRHIYRRVRGRWIDEDSTSLVSAEQDILTVFFFDLQGFTAWSRKTDPSVVMLCLNQMMAAFLDSTTRQEIQVIEYMGDGFLALARGPHHAHRAVQAALDLHVALAQFNRPRKLLGLAEFACRLGVSTGEVVLGNVGTYEKIDFRAVGTTVNMAARLQNEAIPGRPCIARSTWDVVQSDFDYEDNCPRSLFLKGIGDVDAWDVIGPTEH